MKQQQGLFPAFRFHVFKIPFFYQIEIHLNRFNDQKNIGLLSTINQNNQAVTAKIEILFGCPKCFPLISTLLVQLKIRLEAI
jgi:hypothetical protein